MEARQATPRAWGSFTRPAGRFGLQLAEMCFAMCAGGALLNIAVFATAGGLGYPDLAQRSTGLAMLIIGIDWAIAMAVWMAFRGHGWRHNIEMSSTAIVAALAFAFGTWAGVIQVAAPLGWFSLFALMCGPACLLMAADMLVRHKHYTGRPQHGQHAT